MSVLELGNEVVRQRCARVAAVVLVLHGLIEVSGLLALSSLAQTLQHFGGLEQAQIEANALTIALFGVVWGAGRLAAAWGVWRLRKWAFALGLCLSLATVVTALTIIPAGVADTFFAIPALALLLYAWFGTARLDHFAADDPAGAGGKRA